MFFNKHDSVQIGKDCLHFHSLFVVTHPDFLVVLTLASPGSHPLSPQSQNRLHTRSSSSSGSYFIQPAEERCGQIVPEAQQNWVSPHLSSDMDVGQWEAVVFDNSLSSHSTNFSSSKAVLGQCSFTIIWGGSVSHYHSQTHLTPTTSATAREIACNLLSCFWWS